MNHISPDLNMQKILDLIIEATSCFDDDKTTISGSDKIIVFNYDLEALDEELKLKEVLKNTTYSYRYGLIRQSIIALRNQSQINSQMFLQEVDNRISRIISNQQNAFKFIFPVNVLPAFVNRETFWRKLKTEPHRPLVHVSTI